MKYESNSELYHYGIKGMKWGVRRFQKKDGTLTSSGKKRYKPTQIDKMLYGAKGAKRIADRRNKGDSRTKAVAKELGRRAVTNLTITAIGSATSYAITSGKAGKILNAGKQAIKNYNNVSILDKSGNVITSYHEKIKVGEAVTNALMRRE